MNKPIMNSLIRSFALLFVLPGFFLWACNVGGETGTEANNPEVQGNPTYGEHKVEVYYFHGDRRCPACNGVENVSKAAVNEVFGSNNQVAFHAVNFERQHNKELAGKYGVGWSSLIVASGDEITDLTMEAFQMASSNPEKLKELISSAVNEHL